MLPQAIFLIRHGESAADADGTVHASIPDHLIPLTSRGEAQAEAAGAWLSAHCPAPVWVWSSTHLRTLQTLAGLRRGGLQPAAVRHSPLLREQEATGGLEPPDLQAQRERLQQVVGKFHLRLPGGESRADVFLRVTVWMDELWRAFRDERHAIGSVVVVAHGVTLLLIRARWRHWDIERLEAEPRPANAGVYQLAHTPDSACRWRDLGLVFAPNR